MVDFGSSYCLENCCGWSTQIKVLESLQEPSISRRRSANLRNQNHSTELPFGCDSVLILSLFKDFQYGSSISVSRNQYSKIFKCIFRVSGRDIAGTSQFDCTINLSSSAEPSYGRIYQLTREEDKVMQEWIAENLAKGFIRNSSSPYGAPCFFVKQKDKLRLCMDYRGLNKQTIKDRNPIPLISEMLRTLSSGKIFTTLDLRGAYNLLRIKEGDEPKTAFITKYDQFEFLVMPLD
ncbi:hypothetical protein BASA83_009480 [Batrachochytrium salamandrivorans]|nr:hypothetical protein BASA83_009480 [Batrachochytrium salamandrivorans]